MNKTVIIILIFAMFLAVQAQATPRGNFGLGIIVGEPTGLNMKLFLNEENAIEGAIAWSLSSDNNVHLQAEYLYHNYSLIQVSKGQLPFFFGLGGRVVIRENADDLVGIRIPVGLSYEFDGGIFDVFGELVPILDLVPDTDFELEGAIGARFWF